MSSRSLRYSIPNPSRGCDLLLSTSLKQYHYHVVSLTAR